MEKNESKKAYMFYASDYHFEMIGLLNISKEIKENKKVVVLTQNDLQDSVETVLSRINLKEDEKQKIKQINWNQSEKQEELKNVIFNAISEKKSDQKVSIYIKGDEEFIEEQNKKINELMKVENTNEANWKNITVTDCYNFSEIADRSNEIAKRYSKKLNTI